MRKDARCSRAASPSRSSPDCPRLGIGDSETLKRSEKLSSPKRKLMSALDMRICTGVIVALCRPRQTDTSAFLKPALISSL